MSFLCLTKARSAQAQARLLFCQSLWPVNSTPLQCQVSKLLLHPQVHAGVVCRSLTYNRELDDETVDQNDEADGGTDAPSFDFIDPGPVPDDLTSKKYPVTLALARKILKDKQYHGYPGFRDDQEKVIARLHHKGPTIYMMRTGGGKSLIYQILARTIPEDGIILVVEPLISLLRDQVKSARAVGLEADGIDGTMSESDIESVHERLREREIRMLFVAPERLQATAFLKALYRNTVLMLVIDEVHLIPLEGPKYRTAFLDLANFYHRLLPQRLLLTTATATEKWLQDLARAFQVPETGIFRASVYRPNLSLQVQEVEDELEKYLELVKALKEVPGTSIVYVSRRKEAERIAERLRADVRGREFEAYHARIHSKKRNAIQEKFTEKLRTNLVIVSTKAFGMGLNKSDVRQVIHYSLSPDPSEYLQEVGRAGRDGLPSRCLTFFQASDPHDSELKIRHFMPTLRNVQHWLEEIAAKCKKGATATFEYDISEQARRLDIEHITLDQLYKILEMRARYRYFKPASSRCVPMKFKFRLRLPKPKKGQEPETDPDKMFSVFKELILSKDDSEEAHALLNAAYRRNSSSKTWYVKPRELTNEDMILQDLQNKMLDWSEGYKIRLNSLGVKTKFKVLAPLPPVGKELNKLAQELHVILSARVDNWVERLDTMASILDVNTDQCIAARLTGLFGSSIPGSGKCGICTGCINGKSTISLSQNFVEKEDDAEEEPIVLKRRSPRSRRTSWQRRYLRELELFEKVYQAVLAKKTIYFKKGQEHDAEFLCKLAFGIRSELLTSSGLQGSKISGSLGHWNYDDLHEAFNIFTAAKQVTEEDEEELDDESTEEEDDYVDDEDD